MSDGLEQRIRAILRSDALRTCANIPCQPGSPYSWLELVPDRLKIVEAVSAAILFERPQDFASPRVVTTSKNRVQLITKALFDIGVGYVRPDERYQCPRVLDKLLSSGRVEPPGAADRDERGDGPSHNILPALDALSDRGDKIFRNRRSEPDEFLGQLSQLKQLRCGNSALERKQPASIHKCGPV